MQQPGAVCLCARRMWWIVPDEPWTAVPVAHGDANEFWRLHEGVKFLIWFRVCVFDMSPIHGRKSTGGQCIQTRVLQPINCLFERVGATSHVDAWAPQEAMISHEKPTLEV